MLQRNYTNTKKQDSLLPPEGSNHLWWIQAFQA